MLKPGMRGALGEVVSHVVMSNVEDGEVYTWDEWEVKDASGKVRSLEFDDGEWKLMERFQPLSEIPAGDLPVLGKGITLPIDAPRPEVVLVSVATVREIEGRPTYETEAGETADYFDAEAGDTLYSVEWQGDAVEYYRGRRLDEAEVRAAFSL